MRNEEWGMRNEELGVRNEELGVRNEELGVIFSSLYFSYLLRRIYEGYTKDKPIFKIIYRSQQIA